MNEKSVAYYKLHKNMSRNEEKIKIKDAKKSHKSSYQINFVDKTPTDTNP